jgi:UDP-glucose 4-epimerase
VAERALVTGGAGFIGSNLVRELLSRGSRVRVFDDLSTGRRENLADVAGDVEVVEGDLRDTEAVARAMDGVSRVFHQGAVPSVLRSVNDPLTSHEVNATGTLNVLVAARDAGIERVVYASSSSVYGNAEELPTRETLPTRPISPYGVSKLAGERYCGAFAATYGMGTVALRYFNVFGPWQNPASEYAAVVPRFITATLRGEQVTVFGDGDQSRDFTFVGDVVAANLLAAEAEKRAWGGVFNVAYSERHSVNQLLEAIRRASGKKAVDPAREPARPGDIRNSQADITQARQVLGYEPRWSFDEGLRQTVVWFRERV